MFLGVRDAVVLWAGVDRKLGGLGMTPAALGDVSGYINIPIAIFSVLIVPAIADVIGARRRLVVEWGLID